MDLSTRQLRYIVVTDSFLNPSCFLSSVTYTVPRTLLSRKTIDGDNIREEIKGRTCGLAFRISKAAGSPDYIVRYEKLRRRLYLGQLVEALRALILVNLARGGDVPGCYRTVVDLLSH